MLRSLIPLLMLFSCSAAQSSSFVLRQWKVQDGLPQSTVRCITQTQDGYLWVGTWQGLARFDGVRMTVFRSANTPQLLTSNIMSLCADSRGRLWVGTDAGGLVLYDRGRFRAFDSTDGIAALRILHIEEDRTGRIWCATEAGIFSYDGSVFLRYTAANGLPATYANQVLPLPSSGDSVVLYLGFVGTGAVVRIVHDTLIVQEQFAVGGYLITADTDGVLWYGARGRGFVRREKGRETIDTRYAGELPGETYRVRDGEKWLLTPKDIRIIRTDGEERLSSVEGVTMSDVTTVFEDREGNLWLGKEGGGLLLLRPRNVRVLAAATGFPTDMIQCIVQDSTGMVWAGTWDAGLLRMSPDDPEHPTAVTVAPEVSGVYTLTPSRDGSLYIGSWGKGLYRRSNGVTTHIVDKIVSPFTSIVSIAEDRRGTLWIGTAHEGVLERSRAGSRVWNDSAGLSGNRVNAILAARNGDVWVTVSSRGVNRIANGTVTRYTAGSGLPDKNAAALYEDRDGAVWVGTNRGLARWKNGSFTMVTEAQGLVDGAIAQILQDDEGNFWIGAIHGIYRVTAQDLNGAADGTIATVRCITIGAEDGMLNEETGGGGTPRCWKTSDGRLWFTSTQGAVIVDPRRVAANRYPPSVMIEEAWVEHRSVPVAEQIILTPGEEKIEFRYTGINFTAPSKIRFRYRLEGFEENWNEAGDGRNANYTNLEPGTYTFRVSAENSAGIPAVQEASLRIIVEPPFTATWWFRSLIALAFLTIGPAVYAVRVRQFRREQQRQKEFARQLLGSQEAERKRIATELHDGLGQSLLIVKNKLLMALQHIATDHPSASAMTDASDLASQTIEEVRSVSHNLRPHQLDQLGLTKTLRSIVRQTRDSTGLAVTAELADLTDRFTAEEEIALFRIVQESFNNIIKHAHATEAVLTVRREADAVTVIVRDNGTGLTGAEGFGLSGIRERASLLGWSVLFASDHGTVITVTIPGRNG